MTTGSVTRSVSCFEVLRLPSAARTVIFESAACVGVPVITPPALSAIPGGRLPDVIAHDDAEKFKPAGIDDLAEHFRGKTIRVTGKIIAEDGQVRIRVTEPGQIAIIEAAKP